MTRTGLAALLSCAVLVGACSATSGVRESHDPGTTRVVHTSAAAPSTSTPSPAVPSVVAKTVPNPCRHNARGQLVRVDLRRQHLWMCQGARAVHQSAITSGMRGVYTRTPTGHFRIQGLDRDQTLTLLDGRQYRVKYWIPFDAPLFGFHDASWQTFPFGSAKYARHGSHGCVHMPLRAIATLYHWAHVGTRVTIER